MRTVVFAARVEPDGRICLPEEAMELLKSHDRAEVFVTLALRNHGQDWERLALEEFLSGYDETDAIYDDA